MTGTFPFLTAYDPPGTSEGSLDPLGLYQIADQLAMQLVPGVRERMQRIRFLVAMAVSALVREELDSDPRSPDASPYLVWEWLVVLAMVRSLREEPGFWGVPGSLVARRADEQYGYLDARSYLKTPRIFGFHGVYKRLAVEVGLVTVDLAPGPNAERVVDAWASGAGYGGLEGARSILLRWTDAIDRSLRGTPPQTRPNWRTDEWEELARAFAPWKLGIREKRQLQELLLTEKDGDRGALPVLWELQLQFDDEGYQEEELHRRLETAAPRFAQLVSAIRSYESFARSLQDAFDVLRAEAARPDSQGFPVHRIAKDDDFRQCVNGLQGKFESAHRDLAEVECTAFSLPNLFQERFARFAEPLDEAACALALCEHHEMIQKGKSAEGKRPWFDRLGQDRIYMRHRYREPRPELQPDRYVHYYRGWPIRRFHADLS